MLVFGGLMVGVAWLGAADLSALGDTREANSGISSAFQMAAVFVSLIVLGSAFRNSRRRRRAHR